MVNICVLLISFAVMSFTAHSTIQSKDPSQKEDFGLEHNETSFQGQPRWLKKPGGWSKLKPCGKPEKPLCPTEGTTLPLTKPTTKPSTTKLTTTTGNAIITPSNDEEPISTMSPTSTTSPKPSPKPITTTRRPKPSTEYSRPTFATTSSTSTDVTQPTAEPTTTTTRRPLPTPFHDGGIVFPDDDEYFTSKSTARPIPTTSSKPTPTTTTSTPVTTLKPKPSPDGDVEDNKETESTTVTTFTTTQSSSIQECIRNCPVTPEYNPVCGSDDVTYSNPGRLSCAQFCGVNASMRARGLCRSTTAAPSSTTPVITTSTTPSSVIRECIRNCPMTSEYYPVCGSDGVTYSNLGRFNCVFNCGVNITVATLGPCSGTTSTTPSSTGSTQSPVIRQCIRNCPVTAEYNPVCGSDGVTYTNPGRLTCAQDCGVNVQLLLRGPCSQISTTAAPTTTTESVVIRDCRRNCPVTPEYNPVCGSNGVTYNNASHLRCAQNCKVDVQLTRQGRCPWKI